MLSVLALLAALSVAAACGSDNSTDNQLSNADVAGDWTMVSYQIVPRPAYTPPAAAGTLRLTDTDYHVFVALTTGEVVDTVANDSGTYNVDGSIWTQTSTNPEQPPSAGTVSLMKSGAVETLQVNTTAAGVLTHSIWTRRE
jgi:hypothetical protein